MSVFRAAEAAAPISARRIIMISMRPGFRTTIGLIIAVSGATVLPVMAPQLTRQFVDQAVAGSTLGPLVILAGGYLVLAAGGLVARTIAGWLADRWAWDGTNRIRERTTEHVLGLDLAAHGRKSPGELIARVDGDVMGIAGFVVAFVMDIVVSVLIMIGVVISAFMIDRRLGLALGGYCLLMIFVMVVGQRLVLPAARRSSQVWAEMFGGLEETMGGVEDIRSNGAGRHMLRRFHRTSGAWYRSEAAELRVGILVRAAIAVVFAGGTASLLGLTAWLLSTGAVTVGIAVLLVQYILLIQSPFERLTEQLRHVQGVMAGVIRTAELLDLRPAVVDSFRSARPATRRPPNVSLDRVTFQYSSEDQPALRDVTLTVAAGTTLGLVGRTGSGKSTIGRLLLRLYDPSRGAVRIDDVDLRDVARADLRRTIGLVTQDVQLFEASVRDNLTLFRESSEFVPEAGEARLRQVINEVGLGDWLDRQPDGLDTVITGLSAGESQLLAFARVMLADPAVVVLDEPTSRLDRATEKRIDACVRKLLHGRTGVMIAHRLASLSVVDSVAVVADGRIVEHGPREELAADPRSRFARLVALGEGLPR